MRWALIAILMGPAVLSGWGQAPLFREPGQGGAKVEAVAYLYPEQVTLPAGKASTVELHFRVGPGLHINSHDPKDKFLIPTAFWVPDGAGVRLVSADYPAGADFALPADPTMKLSVFTGEFAIQARMVASAGDHLMEAKLRYQACDEAQCMPPKTITVPIDVVGK
jgi:hypothetical protein